MRSQIEESFITKRQIHTLEKDNYMIQLTFCPRKGLIVRVLTIQMIEKNQYYSLQISDESMGSALRGIFEEVSKLFTFMKNQNSYYIKIENGVIGIKYLNYYGDIEVKQTIELNMQRKKLSFDKVTDYMIKNRLKKFKQQNELQREQQRQNTYNLIFKKQNQAKKTICILTLAIIVMMILFSGIFFHLNRRIEDNLLKNQQQLNNQIFQKWLKERQIIANEATSKILNNKILQNDQNQVKLKQLSQLIENVQKKIEELPTKRQLNTTQSKLKQLSSLIESMKTKIEEFPTKEQLNTTQTQVIINTIKSKELNFENKINSIVKQIQETQKSLRLLSNFELSSKFIEYLYIDGNSVTNLGITGRRTQISLRDDIPYEKSISYKFNIVNSSPDCAIAIGIVDAFGVKEYRSSLHLKNTIAYTGRGNLWRNGTQEKFNGITFSQGSQVVMKVELSKGTIKWLSQGKTIAEIQNEQLKNNFIKYRPYIQMSNKGDIIQFVPTAQ